MMQKEYKIHENGYEFLSPLIIDEANDAVIMINEKGNICIWNKAASNLFGYSKDEVLGKNLHKFLVPARYRNAHEKAFVNFMKTGKGAAIGKSLDLYGLHKKGHEIPIELFLKSFKIDDLWYAAGYIKNITEKFDILSELSSSEQKYNCLVDNFALGVSIINREMEVISLNKKMKDWFSLSEIDLKNKVKCYRAFNNPPRDEICVYCPTCKTLEDGEIHESITATPDGDKLRNYRVISTPLKNEAGATIAVIESVEDITEKLATENELNKLDKLESLGVLAGGIAHDFKNMLTSLMGNIALAKDVTKEMEDVQKYLSNAENACSRAKDLTSKLMTFAKGNTTLKTVTSMKELIYETVSFSTAGSKAEIVYEISGDLDRVNVDKSQISQVINNLIINACQAMPSGGKIEIKGINAILKNNDISKLPEGKYIKISFRDYGSGIPEEIINKVFDPFFSTKESGTGLGLASCHSIIESHSGKLLVQSTVGKGTVFTIYLPIATKELLLQDESLKKINIPATPVLL